MKQAFARWLEDAIAADPRVILLAGDLGYKTFEGIAARFPRSYFNMGVSEQNMIGVAAGLALKGFRPYCYSIAPFLALRALEQIRNDVCFYGLDVTLVGNGGGLGYGLQGSSHHTLEDLAVLAGLPGMRAYLPFAKADVAGACAHAARAAAPTYLRLTHELPEASVLHGGAGEFAPVRRFFRGGRRTVLALGSLAPRIAAVVREQGRAEDVSIFAVAGLPLESGEWLEHARASGDCVVFEEHGAHGGLGAAASLLLMKNGVRTRFAHHAIEGYQDERLDGYFGLLARNGLSPAAIAAALDGV